MIHKRLNTALTDAKKYVYLSVLFQWITLLAQVVIVFFTARLLDASLSGRAALHELYVTAAVCAGVLAVRAVTTRLSMRCTFLAGRDVKMILRKKLYGKLLRLGMPYREHTTTAEAVQLASEGIEQLELYFGRYLPQFFYSLLAPLTLFAILAPFCLEAAAVLLLCVPLIPVSIVAVQKIAKRLLKKYWGIYAGLGDSFLENLQGLTTLKIFQADGRKADEMDYEAERFRKITMKVLTMQLNSITIMDIIAYGGAAAGIITAFFAFERGSIPLSTVIITVLLSAEFFIPLRLLGSFFHIAMNGMAAADKMFHLLDLPETELPADAVSALDTEAAAIEVRNLSFSYDGERTVLNNVDIRVPAGSLVSFVGESGCGKSTLAAVITGRHRSYTGAVLFGSTELHRIPEPLLMKHVTVIGHSVYLFKGTVRSNLQTAKPDASDEEMIAVLKQVNLHSFLAEQQGLDTVLQEKAQNLSGGQRQRLALARALLFDSPVYIFDEATSNIDPESEEAIMRVIYGLKETKTVVLISHRLINTVKSDCIYVLKNGSLAEKGRFDELIAAQGVYCTLYRQQQALEHYGEARE